MFLGGVHEKMCAPSGANTAASVARTRIVVKHVVCLTKGVVFLEMQIHSVPISLVLLQFSSAVVCPSL